MIILLNVQDLGTKSGGANRACKDIADVYLNVDMKQRACKHIAESVLGRGHKQRRHRTAQGHLTRSR